MQERILQKRVIYIIGFIAISLYSFVGIIGYFIPYYTLYIISVSLIGIFVAGVILYLGTKEITIHLDPSFLLMICFIIWLIFVCVFATFENKKDYVLLNRDCLNDAAISTLVIFPLGYAWVREEKKIAMVKVIFHFVLFGWTLFIIYVLFEMFQAHEIILPNGGVITTKKGAGLELNCNINLTGAWEMLFFMACLFMSLAEKKLLLKMLYGIASFIHYFTIVISSCRTAFLSSLFAFAGMIGVIVFLKTQERSKKSQWIMTLFITLAAGGVFYLLRNPLYRLFGVIAYPVQNVEAKDMIHKYSTILSGRETLWVQTMQAITRSPRQFIIGSTPAAIWDLLEKYGAPKGTYTHNEILELVADTGIVGFGFCLAWLVIILMDSYKMYFVKKERSLILCIPIIFISLLIANMFEAMLLFFMRASGYMFFFLGGMIHGAMNKKRIGSLSISSNKCFPDSSILNK